MIVQNLSCERAIAQIEAFLGQPSTATPELDAALAHLRGCASCGRRLQFLASALAHAQEDQLSCDECAEYLPALAAGVELGQAADRQHVLLHLASCPYCAALYQQLREPDLMEKAELSQRALARPDLSFLPRSAPDRLGQVGRLILEFSDDLLRMFKPRSFAMEVRKAQPDEVIREQITLPAAPADLWATITIERARAGATTCDLLVEVQIRDRAWPQLAGIEVVLQRGDQPSAVKETDAFGKVSFEGVAVADLPQLRLVITPEE